MTAEPDPGVDDYRAVLRHVGLILMIVGALDIGFMIFCIYNGVGYSSSFNIFALLGGFFLWRGSLRAVRIVTFMSALMLTGFLGLAPLALVFGGPLDLWMIKIRLYPVAVFESALFGFIAIALPWWVYRQLRLSAVLEARQAAGHGTAPPPWIAFIAGGAIIVVLAGGAIYLSMGPAPAKAIEIARAHYGDDYRYHVAGFHSGNAGTEVRVVAYNDREIKTVQIHVPP